jgi:hypothetical protein
MRQRRLSEIRRHVLRIFCRRCERTVEIQTPDAVRLYGGNAAWKDVAQRLLDSTCQQRTAGMKKTGAGRRSRRRSPLRIADPISLRLDVRMAPKYHPTPLSGGDRKALAKELGKARAMANILAAQSAETRAKGEALIQQADKLLCESWNERMWSDGEPIDPSPTIDQAVNGGFPWLEIRCARCKTPSDVDLAAMKHPPSTFVHDLASRLHCRKCAKAGRRPPATLLQLAWQPRHPRTEA